MADYIERQAAVSRFEQLKEQADTMRDKLYLDGVLAVVDTLPAANVREDVQGEWIPYYEIHDVLRNDRSIFGDRVLVGYRCSVCGRMEQYEEPFCNCGARMTGGESE